MGDAKVGRLTADILVTSFVSIICVRFKGFDAKRHLSHTAPLYWLKYSTAEAFCQAKISFVDKNLLLGV